MKHKVEEVELATGPRGLLLSVPGSSVVNFAIGFRAGFIYAPKKLAEIPHLMEHTIFCANSKYKSKIDFTASLEKNGASSNAYTSEFLIVYHAEAADFEDSRILGLFNTAITTPKFLPSEVNTEIGNVREELSARRSQHSHVAYDLLEDAMLGRRTDETGLLSLPNINQKAVRAFHGQTHTQNNAYFIIAGNLKNRQKLLGKIEKELSKLPKGSATAIPAEPISMPKQAIIMTREIPQIYYDFRQYSEPLSPSQWPALSVLRTILSGRWKSWIFGEARKRGLAYSVGLSYDTNPTHTVQHLYAFVTPANAEELFRLFTKSLLKAKAGKFTAGEISEAKHFIVGSRLRAFKTPGALASWYGEDYFVHQHISDFHKSLADVKRVSMDDVTAVARQILARPMWGLSLVGAVDQQKARKLYGILSDIWN